MMQMSAACRCFTSTFFFLLARIISGGGEGGGYIIIFQFSFFLETGRAATYSIEDPGFEDTMHSNLQASSQIHAQRKSTGKTHTFFTP